MAECQGGQLIDIVYFYYEYYLKHASFPQEFI